jgi:hypothetical protein
MKNQIGTALINQFLKTKYKIPNTNPDVMRLDEVVMLQVTAVEQ